MKSFLKMLLATMVGIILLVFLSFVVLLSFASLSDTKVIVSENSILKLDLNRVFYERVEDNPFASINPISGQTNNGLGLNQIREVLKQAKSDPKISGIYLNGGIPMAGHATLTEFRNALVDFKESGKFIFGYTELLTQKGLYITSIADSTLVNPEGFVEWKGLSASVSYYQEALNKLGLKPEVLRATGNKFKSAVEPYLRQTMSDENRLQLDALIGSVWGTYLEDIGAARNISKDNLNALADDYALTNPEIAHKNGLIDGIAYYDEVLDVLVDKTGAKSARRLKFIGFEKYRASYDTDRSGSRDNKIAVIIAQGDIVGGDGGEYSIGSERISKAIRKARNNEDVKAVVLRVNSPGGSALASEVIWREMDLTRQEKPVVASMGDLAASGGYYISCYADTIVAHPNTITGSIGAFGLFMTGEELMHDKLGINIETVSTNKYGDLGTFDRALTDSEKAILIASVDKIYGTFKERVATGRNMSIEMVDSLGQGRVWSGKDALDRGLVDVLGGLDDAIEIAKNMAGLDDDYSVVEYPKLEDPIARLIKELGGDIETRMIKNKLGEFSRYVDLLEKTKSMQGFQTRLEYDLVID
jgi:protease-4